MARWAWHGPRPWQSAAFPDTGERGRGGQGYTSYVTASVEYHAKKNTEETSSAVFRQVKTSTGLFFGTFVEPLSHVWDCYSNRH